MVITPRRVGLGFSDSTMPTIHLSRSEWHFDDGDHLGPPGGFGEVFRGAGSDGTPAAIKRLNLTAGQAAHREMTIGASLAERTLQHVVPVLDFGQDAESDRYFLAMPICDGSLQEVLRSAPLDFEHGRGIILDILAGLEEVGDLVHRDLKPGNVLAHEGRWKIADFGIAKFVEDSTSLETLRNSLTPWYGAPEQWLGERPTKATDIYALGCIIHSILNGQPPFTGSGDDVREGHLHRPPPSLNAPPAVAAVVSQMLRKAPEGRPSMQRVRAVLTAAQAEAPAGPRAALAAVARQIATERAAAEAAVAELRSRESRWQALAQEALDEYGAIRARLFAEVDAVSADVNLSRQGLQWGAATLAFQDPTIVPYRLSAGGRQGNQQQWERPRWDVAAWAVTSLECRLGTGGRSYRYGSTLFFGCPTDTEEYRWHEVSFWTFGDTNGPHGLDMSGHDAVTALSPTMGVANVAFGPESIDAEDEERFQNRWLSLVARAAAGNLHRPNQMPPPANFFE